MVVDEMTLETYQVVQLDLLHIRWVPSPILFVPAWIFHKLANSPQQVERYIASRGWYWEGAIERYSVPREGLMYQHWAVDNYLPCFLRFWQFSANSKTLHWDAGRLPSATCQEKSNRRVKFMHQSDDLCHQQNPVLNCLVALCMFYYVVLYIPP